MNHATIYFVPIFIPHQLSVRHNLRVSCNCAACFFKREIQVALFTFTHLHRHVISSPSPIHHFFTFTNSPFLYLHQFTISLPSPIHHFFTNLSSLYPHQLIISLPSPIYISSPSPIISLPSPIYHHLFVCMFTFTFRYPTIVLDRLVYVFNHM